MRLSTAPGPPEGSVAWRLPEVSWPPRKERKIRALCAYPPTTSRGRSAPGASSRRGQEPAVVRRGREAHAAVHRLAHGRGLEVREARAAAQPLRDRRPGDRPAVAAPELLGQGADPPDAA